MSDPFEDATIQLLRALRAAQESVLEHCLARGLAIDHVERPNGVPTADRPIIYRGKRAERHAAIWLDFDDEIATVRVELPARIQVLEATLGFSLDEGLTLKAGA
jgi:hypothetical protein